MVFLLEEWSASTPCPTVGSAIDSCCLAISLTFISQATADAGLPQIEVDPQTYRARADGVRLSFEPADVLPKAQHYFLF
nr:hypothetical protein [Pseudomonas mucidolens]